MGYIYLQWVQWLCSHSVSVSLQIIIVNLQDENITGKCFKTNEHIKITQELKNSPVLVSWAARFYSDLYTLVHWPGLHWAPPGFYLGYSGLHLDTPTRYCDPPGTTVINRGSIKSTPWHTWTIPWQHRGSTVGWTSGVFN